MKISTEEVSELIRTRDNLKRDNVWLQNHLQMNLEDRPVDFDEKESKLALNDNNELIAQIQKTLDESWEPGEKEKLLEESEQKVREFLEFGITKGWWKDFDREKVDAPIRHPIVVNFTDFPEKSKLAHVFVKLKIFDSVSDANKSGWNKPIVRGIFKFKKAKLEVHIV